MWIVVFVCFMLVWEYIHISFACLSNAFNSKGYEYLIYSIDMCLDV